MRNKYTYYSLLVIQLLVIGLVLPTFLHPDYFFHGFVIFDSILNSILANVLSFFISQVVFYKLDPYPHKRKSIYLLPICLLSHGMVLFILFLGHFQYSVQVIFAGFILSLFFISINYFYIFCNIKFNLLTAPFGEVDTLLDTPRFVFKRLDQPKLPRGEFDGIVMDFSNASVSEEWESFLAKCTLEGVHVYSIVHLKETISGRVNLSHLIENDYGCLKPPQYVIFVKRILDILFLILIFPFVLVLLGLISILIALDSDGGVFFRHSRVGFNGRKFTIIKFRTMNINQEGDAFTKKNEDTRITRVGRVLRKYRLDEIPQFWNVLKGEMSLIGPRPESIELANLYQKEVPFFMYRHVVRPGISGWAQVMQGYAAGADEMKEKVAYDLFYIKHISLWLDLLIWFKTIKTVFSGFGSR